MAQGAHAVPPTQPSATALLSTADLHGIPCMAPPRSGGEHHVPLRHAKQQRPRAPDTRHAPSAPAVPAGRKGTAMGDTGRQGGSKTSGVGSVFRHMADAALGMEVSEDAVALGQENALLKEAVDSASRELYDAYKRVSKDPEHTPYNLVRRELYDAATCGRGACLPHGLQVPPSASRHIRRGLSTARRSAGCPHTFEKGEHTWPRCAALCRASRWVAGSRFPLGQVGCPRRWPT
jgi:hypothetical protein